MKSNLLIVMALTIFWTAGCNEKKSDDNQNNQEQQVNVPEHNLILNDGNKWKADSMTIGHIHDMGTTLENVNPEMEGSIITAAESLKGIFDLIIQDCTMDGPAHDQLHNYLMIVRPSIKEMYQATGEEAVQSFLVLKKTIKLFDDYFEL